MAYLRKSVEDVSTLCLHSNLNEVPNATEPQQEHKQITLTAVSKGGIFKVMQKDRETKRDSRQNSVLRKKHKRE